MRVIVDRASNHAWDDDCPPPIEGAAWLPIVRVQIRTVKTREEWEAHPWLSKTPWGSKGRNWRFNDVDGYATWDSDDHAWCVDVLDERELIKLVEREGRCVLEPPDYMSYNWKLTVYDDYLE